MANPTLSNPSGLPWFLEAATFFSDKHNLGNKFQGTWTYPQIELLLKEIARNLGISIENPNFEQVTDFLLKLFEKQEDLLESKIPPNLKLLLEEYEKSKEKAVLLRQQEAVKIEAWLAAKEKYAKHSETIRRISIALAKRLSESPLPPSLVSEVAIKVVPYLEVEPEILIEIEKTKQLPESPEKTRQQVSIEQYLQQVWEQAIRKTSQELPQATKLTQEQIDYLNSRRPETSTLVALTALPGPEKDKQEIVTTIKNNLTPPLHAQEATAFIQTIEESFLDTLPQIGLSLEKLEKLPTDQQEQILIEVIRQIEQAVIVAVAENYQPLTKQVSLAPERVTQLLKVSTPQTIEELKIMFPLLSISPEERLTTLTINPTGSLLTEEVTTPTSSLPVSQDVYTASLKGTVFVSPATPTPSLLVTEQVASLPTNTQSPPLFNQRGQVLSVGPSQLLQLADVNKPKAKIIDGLKQELQKTGISPSGVAFFQTTLSEQQAFILTIAGVKPEDLEHTILVLKDRGVRIDSPVIKELQAARENLSRFQLTNKIPQEEILAWQRQRQKERTQGRPSLTLPFSRFRTPIAETTTYSPKTKGLFGTQGVVRKIFGEKVFSKFFGEKAVFFKKQILLINKINLFKARISSKVATWFFKTGLGKSIKIGIQKASSKTLQGLWLAMKVGTKKIGFMVAKKGLQGVVQGIAHLIGVSIAPGVSNILIAAGSFILKKSLKPIKWFIRSLSTGFGITKLLGSLSYPDEEEKWVGWVIVGTFIGLIVLSILGGGVVSSTFIQPGGVGESLVPPGVEIPPECQNTRHLSEETICKLSRKPAPCNNSKINKSTWPQVEQCFSQISLTGKDIIQNHFDGSVQRNDNLQCVGFTVGIKGAEGRSLIILESARDYLSVSVPGYNITTTGKPKPNVGDLFVWRGGTHGHIAILVAVEGKTEDEEEGEEEKILKIIVAEADGLTGKIALVAYPYSALGAGNGSPDGLLQPN